MTAKERKKRYIIDKAIQCLAEKPRSTLIDIAEKASIGIATLHRYFESRDKLILEIAYNALEIVSKSICSLNMKNLCVKDYFMKLSQSLIPLGDKIYFLNKEDYLEDDKKFLQEEEKIWSMIIADIKKYQKLNELRSDIKPEFIFNIYYTLLFSIWEEVNAGNIAKNEAADVLVKILLNGIEKNKKEKKNE